MLSRAESFVAVCCRRTLAAFQVTFDGIQDSVYELGGLKSGKATRYFKRFVYYDSFWSVAFVEKLVNSETKDVTVHDRHSLDAPMLRSTFYQIIDLVETGNRAKREVVREFTSYIAH